MNVDKNFPVGRAFEIYDGIYIEKLTPEQKNELEKLFNRSYSEILRELRNAIKSNESYYAVKGVK